MCYWQAGFQREDEVVLTKKLRRTCYSEQVLRNDEVALRKSPPRMDGYESGVD
jgi:hypothetical protein